MNTQTTYLQLGARDLSNALQAGEIVLYYQPKISLETGKPVGLEALARWQHPEIGVIPPSNFIPIAESGELIHNFTAIVADLAARQINSLNRAAFPMSVAINVSAANLDRLDFPDRIEEICRRQCGNCEKLTVELTESAQQSVTYLLDTLTRLRIKGASFLTR